MVCGERRKEKNYMRIVIAALACFLAMREDTFNRIIWSLLTVAFMLSMKDFAYSDKTKRIGNIFSALQSTALRYILCICRLLS